MVGENNMNNLQVVEQREILGMEFKIYGDFENPLFLAKDVAIWIEHSNVTDMISRIDEDEVAKFNLGGKQGECNFVTEDGLYEILMQSRKPIAKEFKKKVKEILKDLRKGNTVIAPKNDLIGNFQAITQMMQVMTQQMQEVYGIVENAENIVRHQDIQHRKQIDETKELIGLRAKNTSSLVKLLKSKISSIKGYNVSAKDYHYNSAKERIFRSIGVWMWEDIPTYRYSEVHAIIDTIETIEDIFDI